MTKSLEECDWFELDYYALSNKVRRSDWLTEEEFFNGPFRRFLELGCDPDNHPRARARGMEHAVFALSLFCERQQSKGASGEAIAARAYAIAVAWFADKPDGDYMLEVMEGTSNHHGRSGVRTGVVKLLPQRSARTDVQG